MGYLGYVISSNGIETDPSKIDAVTSWEVPKNVDDIRKFLGFTGYYRRFVKDYSKIAKPLNDLLGEPKKRGRSNKNYPPKQPPFVWGTEQQQAFDTLKEALTTAPILAYPNFTKPYKLHTDASGAGLGAVFYQGFVGKEHVIAYASQGLKSSEKNYPAHKLEFLALEWSVCHKFHEYLYGNKFEVLTDNNPLTYVLTTAKLDATGHRWLAELSLYDFSIKYRPGLKNGDADGLSRRSVITENEVHSICNGILAQETTSSWNNKS